MGIEIQMPANQRATENRQSPRYRYRGDATVRRLDSDPTLPGRVLDLSARGCLLRLPDLSDFQPNTLVDLHIHASTVAFRALGSVRHRARTRRVIGISFVNLSQRGQAELLALIAELESDEQSGHPVVQEITLLRHTDEPA
ncbi:MAG: PilZ domain-containing protein [Acidobacteriaceae bacterium]|jgi:c-di-GMP-binding flagellar brake protein YcgR